MEFPRIRSESAAAPAPVEYRRLRRVNDASPMAPSEPGTPRDRRRRPDRRHKQAALSGPDRRKRRDRRRPEMLHPRTRQPEMLSERKGNNINASV